MKTVSMMGVLALVAATAMAQSPTTTSGQEPATGQSSTGQSSSDPSSTGQSDKDRGLAAQGSTAATSTESSKTASASSSGRLASADQKFIETAARNGLAEVELGRLAAEKASSTEVKAFGQMLVDEHGKANEELKTLASQKGVTVPAEPDSRHQSQLSKLQGLSGAEFDHAFMKEMVKAHKSDVSEFKKASGSAKDEDVKQWAAKQLPTLEQHLQQAQQTASMGAAAGATTRATGTTGTTPSGATATGTDKDKKGSSDTTGSSTMGTSTTGSSSTDSTGATGSEKDNTNEKDKNKDKSAPDSRK